ncbi:MAG: hypothetical protein WDN72_06100 [Alphaproteobacteria bacterium]
MPYGLENTSGSLRQKPDELLLYAKDDVGLRQPAGARFRRASEPGARHRAAAGLRDGESACGGG